MEVPTNGYDYHAIRVLEFLHRTMPEETTVGEIFETLHNAQWWLVALHTVDSVDEK